MRCYLAVTGSLFVVLALGHLARLLLAWPAQLAGWSVPLWASLPALLLAAGLAAWAWRLWARAPGCGQRRG